MTAWKGESTALLLAKDVLYFVSCISTVKENKHSQWITDTIT